MRKGLDLTLNVGRPATCRLVIARGAIDALDEALVRRPSARAVWAADPTVQAAVGQSVEQGLRRAFPIVNLVTIPEGESGKTLSGFVSLIERFEQLQVDRATTIVAVGGGSAMDVVGFAAASYLRGLPYVCIPTTLTAQVDAAVGGKVAVNTVTAKNAVGAFYHPTHVVIDPGLLPDHPTDAYRDGLAEIVKVATISDLTLFELLEDLPGAGVPVETQLDELVRRAVLAKLALLTPDPFETDLDRLLNFGHETAHALEKALDHSIRHGPAVAVGVATAARVATERGLLASADRQRIQALLRRQSLPWAIDLDAAAVIRFVAALEQVKQVRAGQLRVVLPVGLGQGSIVPEVATDELVAQLAEDKEPG